jgi:hypothetical protein
MYSCPRCAAIASGTIQTTVPLPGPTKFGALDVLEIGESAIYPLIDYSSLCAAVTLRKTRRNKRFTRRTKGQFVRVWRTA